MYLIFLKSTNLHEKYRSVQAVHPPRADYQRYHPMRIRGNCDTSCTSDTGCGQGSLLPHTPLLSEWISWRPAGKFRPGFRLAVNSRAWSPSCAVCCALLDCNFVLRTSIEDYSRAALLSRLSPSDTKDTRQPASGAQVDSL